MIESVVIPAKLSAGQVEQVLNESARKRVGEEMVLESVQVFDIYEGPGLPDGHRSIACKLSFRHPDRTLNDKEVNTVFQLIQNDLDAIEDMQVRG